MYRVNDIARFEGYLVLLLNLSGRWCQLNSKIDEECANEA